MGQELDSTTTSDKVEFSLDWGPQSYLTLLRESTPTFEKAGLRQRYCRNDGSFLIVQSSSRTNRLLESHRAYAETNCLGKTCTSISITVKRAFPEFCALEHHTLSLRENDVAPIEWDWPLATSQQNHGERVALLRAIPYEMTAPVEDLSSPGHQRKALSVNISRGGMLVLMDHAPDVEQVLKVYVPTPITLAETPTLAEVRWTRRLPFSKDNGNGPFFVGLKFMF